MPEKLKDKEEKENFSTFDKNIPSPIKQQQILNSPFDVTKLKYKNFQSSSKQKNEAILEEEHNNTNFENLVFFIIFFLRKKLLIWNKFTKFVAKENEYKMEICNLKFRLEEMINDQKDLIYKYEMTEKFWGTKCEKMEKDYFEITNQNKSQKKEIKRLVSENSSLKSELDLSKKENKGSLIYK